MSWLDGLAAMATGVLSGWGIGGGSLLMVYMTAFRGVEQKNAAAINLLYFLPAAASSIYWHIKNKNIDWQAVLSALPFGLAAAGLTAFLARGLDTDLLKKPFGLFLLYVGLSELFRKSK